MTDYQLNIDYTWDSHVHTTYCRHASGSMEDYVKAAIEKGLKKITFLEHMELGINYFERVWLEDDDFDNYFLEGRYLQEKYKDQLIIGLGVEVGYNPHRREELLTRLNRRSWDLIGLSYHFAHVAELPHHLNLVSRKKENVSLFHMIGCDRLLDDYFANLIEAVDYLPADFLCHLDAGLRFQPGLIFSKKNYLEINTLLTKIKQKNIALEINTSGFDIRKEPFPNKKILKMALDYDIDFVVGSDSHKPDHVGRYFNQLPGLLDDL